MKTEKEIEKLARIVVDAVFHVHKELGPGLLESIYELALMQELKMREIKAESQVLISVFYKGVELTKNFKIDVLVEDTIFLDLKAVESVLPVHKAQIISYLKLADKRLGFLINFNVPLIKNGIKRIVNNY